MNMQTMSELTHLYMMLNDDPPAYENERPVVKETAVSSLQTESWPGRILGLFSLSTIQTGRDRPAS